MVVVPKEDVARLDAVIDEMAAPPESQCELLREHLESARAYLLGSMQGEYILCLQLAHQGVNCISNEQRRQRVKQMIDGLLADQEAHVRGSRS